VDRSRVCQRYGVNGATPEIAIKLWRVAKPDASRRRPVSLLPHWV
jgi:hypothetical protein